jgi:hypothetical protein
MIYIILIVTLLWCGGVDGETSSHSLKSSLGIGGCLALPDDYLITKECHVDTCNGKIEAPDKFQIAYFSGMASLEKAPKIIWTRDDETASGQKFNYSLVISDDKKFLMATVGRVHFLSAWKDDSTIKRFLRA